MTQDQWSAVDQFICDRLIPEDITLTQALADSANAGLPAYSVSAAQGKFLQILALSKNAKNILEIGTLGGYSTIWLARALKDGGRLVTLEFSPLHAEVASANIERAGLSDIVEIRIGKALDTLPLIASEKREPFDFIFIDADKPNIPEYFDWSVKLAKPGTLIVVDNVVRNGALIDDKSEDANVQGVRRFHDQIDDDTRVYATTIQTVGSKGYDGFTIAVVL